MLASTGESGSGFGAEPSEMTVIMMEEWRTVESIVFTPHQTTDCSLLVVALIGN